MTKQDFLGLDLPAKIEVWNEFSRENYWGMEIYNNDDTFFDIYFSNTPTEAVRATHYGDYDYLDIYCYFNGNGNVSSFSLESDFIDIIDVDEMLAYYAQYE